MNTNALADAACLSDHDLLARLSTLAGHERATLAELLAHLAALDARPSAYAAQGYGSLFAYCTQALKFSEDAACTRIDAARLSRRFPVILDRLASGAITLTTVRLLRRHLTPENHREVLESAQGRTREQIETIVATLAPQPDARSCVRKLAARSETQAVLSGSTEPPRPEPPTPATSAMPAAATAPEHAAATGWPPPLPNPRPIVKPTAPERYRVQFTIGQEAREKLRRLQALLRREVPDGDPGIIFDRAVTLLLADVEKKKLGMTTRPRPRRPIRPKTDNDDIRTPPIPTPCIPPEVQRAVWIRDGGQCAFVSAGGHRCTERTYLEYHHVPTRAGHRRQHLATLLAPQPLRSGAALRDASFVVEWRGTSSVRKRGKHLGAQRDGSARSFVIAGETGGIRETGGTGERRTAPSRRRAPPRGTSPPARSGPTSAARGRTSRSRRKPVRGA